MTTFNFDDIMNEASKSRDGGSNTVRLVGNFDVEVAYAAAKTRKKDGTKSNPQISLKLKVLNGPQAGDEAWMNIVLTENSKAPFGRTLLNLGVDAEFLRSLGSRESEDDIRAALTEIAESLVMARYNMTVGPQTNNAAFDSYVINSVLEGPDTSASVPTAAVPYVTSQVPQFTPQPPTLPGQPGGFAPQLTQN